MGFFVFFYLSGWFFFCLFVCQKTVSLRVRLSSSRLKVCYFLHTVNMNLDLESQNHRIARFEKGLKRSSTPLLKRVPYSSLYRYASKWVLNISTVQQDSTTSMGNLFQCGITLTVKKLFHINGMFLWNFLRSNFRPLLLVL